MPGITLLVLIGSPIGHPVRLPSSSNLKSCKHLKDSLGRVTKRLIGGVQLQVCAGIIQALAAITKCGHRRLLMPALEVVWDASIGLSTSQSAKTSPLVRLVRLPSSYSSHT